MLKFLENEEILKEKNKQRKIKYRKDLQLQIEQNKLKKLESEKHLIDENSCDNGISPMFGNKKTNCYHKNDRYTNKLQKLKLSIDNSIINYKINNKYKDFKKNNSINKRDFNDFRIPTDCNYNQKKSKNTLFTINKGKSFEYYNFANNNGTFMKKSLSQIFKNISLKHNNVVNTKTNFDNKYLMKEIDIQILFKGFVEQQIKTINDYSTNLENIFYLQYTKKDNNINLFNYLIKSEKNKAMNSINTEKNKLKSKFGFFPLETIYDSRIEQLFNKILNKIISIYSSLNEMQINNYINEYNSIKNLFPSKSNFHFQNKESDFQNINCKGTNSYIIKNGINIDENKFVVKNKINIEDELNFFDYWRNKFKNEIMKEKSNKINTNETIELINIKTNINNKNENLLNIMPANNFFKNAQFREINKLIRNKNNNSRIKLPDISLKENFFKKRNKSANIKNSDRVFNFI